MAILNTKERIQYHHRYFIWLRNHKFETTNSYNWIGSWQIKLHFKNNQQRHNTDNKQIGISRSNIRHIEREKVEFHTHQTRQQRAYRAVIRNLHHSVQQELVRECIKRMWYKIRNIWNIRYRVTGNPLSLFFFEIEPAASNSEIYHIEYLQIVRVQIEPPHQK
jgi:hypothetical protein